MDNKLENGICFFRATDQYINFLRQIDHRIMNNRNEQRERIYLGVLLTIGIHQYYAPITSYKEHKHGRIKNNDQTCEIITGTDHNNQEAKLALINLNNMFPVFPGEITLIDFSTEEAQYKSLLEKEYSYVLSNKDKILKKAKTLYTLRTKRNIGYINKMCCDFLKLEQEYIKFKN